jgi:type II secretory pathway component GspD/PulD (secretin)
MRKPPIALVVLAFLLLASFSSSYAEARERLGPHLVIKVVRLNYAEAENLASVLASFLSPAGRIVPYAPLNCLIIKDKAHIVHRLVEIIKGTSDQDP